MLSRANPRLSLIGLHPTESIDEDPQASLQAAVQWHLGPYRCTGIDISKRDAKVCVRVQGASGQPTSVTVTMWEAMSNQILALREHLVAQTETGGEMSVFPTAAAPKPDNTRHPSVTSSGHLIFVRDRLVKVDESATASMNKMKPTQPMAVFESIAAGHVHPMLSPRVPELNSFEMLLALARTGSLGAVVTEFGLTQQAVSARLASMEALTGVRLALRTAHGTQLTPAGVVVAEWAARLLEVAHQVDAGLTAMRTEKQCRRLKVAASQTIAEQLLPRWLISLSSAAIRAGCTVPQVLLTATNSEGAIAMVRDGTAELGFIERPSPPAGLSSRMVAHDELVVVAPPGHQWARRSGGISAAELAQTPLVMRESGSGTRDFLTAALHRVLGDDVQQAPPILEFPTPAAVRSAVLAGTGPAVLSRLAVADDLATGRLQAVSVSDLDLRRQLAAIWADGRTPPAGAAHDLLASIADARPTPTSSGRAAALDYCEVLDERDRIARDLHHRVVHRVFAAGMTLQGVMLLVRNQTMADRISTVITELDATIKELCGAIFDLHQSPQRSTSLRDRILDLAESARRGLGFDPDITFRGPLDTVPDVVAAHVSAIVHDALNNVVRNARASTAAITLEVGTDLVLQVTDNGRGLGPASRASGLANLRGRADTFGGSFEITSRPGAGTQLRWCIPLAIGK